MPLVVMVMKLLISWLHRCLSLCKFTVIRMQFENHLISHKTLLIINLNVQLNRKLEGLSSFFLLFFIFYLTCSFVKCFQMIVVTLLINKNIILKINNRFNVKHGKRIKSTIQLLLFCLDPYFFSFIQLQVHSSEEWLWHVWIPLFWRLATVSINECINKTVLECIWGFLFTQWLIFFQFRCMQQF